MEKQTTIKDLAVALNLSPSTISRAMRNASDIKPETKKLVRDLAEKLDYQPNRLAISFLQKQTHTIAVMVPNLDHVMATMVKGVDEVALEAGYTVIVCQSDESFGRELVNANRLLSSLSDGFIISLSSETKVFEHIKKINTKKIPLVLFDRVIDDLKVPKVHLDNFDGGYQATQHLIEQGYKNIVLLAGPATFAISNERIRGFEHALKQNGIPSNKNKIVHGSFSQQHGYEATKELLNQKERPDAIFAVSDRLAIGAMLAIKEKGLTMPDDIGLVGFNNEPVTSLLSPAISSVEIFAFDMGKATAKLFLELLHNTEDMSEEEVIIKPKLFVRASSLRNTNQH